MALPGMQAGDATAIERVTPLLRSMGRSVISCGAAGSAHALKALGNYINACAMINVVGGFMITDRMLRMFKKGPTPSAKAKG